MAKRTGLFSAIARRPSRKPSRITKRTGEAAKVPGPSENPATNLILADIAIRAGTYLARRGVEKGLLAGRYGKETAHDIVKNRSLKQSFTSFVLASVATRSLPGAVVVGGGALAKTLLDRRKSRRRAKVEGDRQLLDQARDK